MSEDRVPPPPADLPTEPGEPASGEDRPPVEETAAPEIDDSPAEAPVEAGPEEVVPEWLARLRAKIAAEQAERGAALAARPARRPVSAGATPAGDSFSDDPGDWEAAAPAGEDDLGTNSPGEITPLASEEPVEVARDDDPTWLRDLLAAHAGEAAPDRPPAPQPRKRNASRQRRAEAAKGSASVSAVRSVVVIVAAAVLAATIFTFWTPADFLSDETREGLRPAYATLSAQSPPTPIPTPIWLRRVGVVSGHRGLHPSTGRGDPGAVCDDGLTENEINFNVASRVVAMLSSIGYDVDLLDEWDSRLDGYQAAALISIHSDSCHQFDLPGATGFKVAAPTSRTTARSDDERLVGCLIDNYGSATGLPSHPSITFDMTDYHSFREISPVTPAAIIELGFMFEDREILTGQPDVLAQGIVAGLLCFLEGGAPTPLPEITPWPTAVYTPTPLETANPS